MHMMSEEAKLQLNLY